MLLMRRGSKRGVLRVSVPSAVLVRVGIIFSPSNIPFSLPHAGGIVVK